MPTAPQPLLPERLVDTLPQVQRTTLATVICGDIATRCDCPGFYLRVLHALISHAGWHGNRVWASQARLAELASVVRRICVKTVQRAIRYFVKNIGLRIIHDPGERLRGPGEHIWVAAGHQKRGEKPVNHYDLSALRRFVPAELLSSECHSPSPHLTASLTNAPFDGAVPDPFAEPPADPLSISAETQHICSVVCPVPIKRAEEAKPENVRSEAPRPEKFERTNLSPKRERSTPAPNTPSSPGERALARLGVSAPMRQTILAAMGETWASHAALYARLQRERGEVRTTPAAYLVAVYRHWTEERAAKTWPDWLETRWQRENAAAARVVHAPQQAGPAHEQDARRTVRRPPSPPPLTVPSPAPPDRLASLPDSERKRLADAGRAALRRSLPGAPAALIERLRERQMAKMLKETEPRKT